MARTSIILMLITLFSKVTGLLREQVMAYFLGTDMLADVYSTSSTIPFTIYGFITAGIVASFIPIYNKIQNNRGTKKADAFTSNIINILLLLSIFITLIIFVLSPLLVKLFAPGYDGEKAILTVHFTKIFSFGVAIALVSSIFIAYLNIKGSFYVPAVTGILMNFLNIFSLVIAFMLNNFYLVAFGFLLSDLLKYILFPRELTKNNYKHRWILNLKDPNIKILIKSSLPIIISVAALDIVTIVDQSMASSLFAGNDGAISALKFALLVVILIHGVIVVSISTTTYPKLSSLVNDDKIKKFKRTMMDSIINAQLLMIPASIGMIILAEPTIRILFQRGNFDSNSTILTASLLVYYLPSAFGTTLRDLLTRGYYSMQDMRTPAVITIIQVLLNIILNIILAKFMGLPGLALATSLSTIFAGLMSLYIFRKKYGRINLKNFGISIIKIIIASLIMAVVTYMTYNSLVNINYIFAYLVSIAASISIYGILVLLARIPQVKIFINQLYHKFINK